jgi:hypothetical protein
MLVAQYSLSQLQTAFGPFLVKNLRLPYGGPTGTGGKFSKGTVLGCVGGSAQSEVATLTINGTSDHACTFTADKVYTVTHAYNASLTTVKTAWEAVFGTGNVAVTGTAGTTYILTFQNQLANVRIGGLFAVTAGVGTPSWARTTRGSSGAGQYDAYLDGTVEPAGAVLATDYLSSPQGELVSEGVRSAVLAPVLRRRVLQRRRFDRPRRRRGRRPGLADRRRRRDHRHRGRRGPRLLTAPPAPSPPGRGHADRHRGAAPDTAPE